MVHSFRHVLLGLFCLGCLANHVAAQKVVRLPLKKRNERSMLSKRDPFAISMQNYIPGAEYYVTASIGTPAQDIELVVDTGSSDTWMFGPNSCNQKTSMCEGGEFDILASRTAEYVPGGTGTFEIKYVSQGSGVQGDYITDQFGVGGVEVDNLTMAVASHATFVPSGIMGIGLSLNEASVSQGIGRYPNYPEVLVSQDQISTTAYSLYLDDLASSTGMIIFGGYDLAKFRDDLVMLPIQPDPFDSGILDAFVVSWTSLGISSQSGEFSILQNREFLYPANLDSGTTLTYMPSQIYADVASYFDVRPNGNGLPAQIDCEFGKTNPGQLIFGLGGPGGVSVAVEFDELVVPYYNGGLRATSSSGAPLCAFGLIDAGENPILLGQTFLRSAYILYDLDNLQVGIAQTVFDSTKSDVLEYSGEPEASRIKTVRGPSLTEEPMGKASAVPTEFTIATVPYPSGMVPESFPTTLPMGPTGIIPLHEAESSAPSSSSSSSSTSSSSKSGSGSTESGSQSSSSTSSTSENSSSSKSASESSRSTASSERSTTTSAERTATSSQRGGFPTKSIIHNGHGGSGEAGKGGPSSSAAAASAGGKPSRPERGTANDITPAFATASVVSVLALFSAMVLL